DPPPPPATRDDAPGDVGRGLLDARARSRLRASVALPSAPARDVEADGLPHQGDAEGVPDMRHAVVLILILIVVAVALLLGACARRDRTDYGALSRGVGAVLERPPVEARP